MSLRTRKPSASDQENPNIKAKGRKVASPVKLKENASSRDAFIDVGNNLVSEVNQGGHDKNVKKFVALREPIVAKKTLIALRDSKTAEVELKAYEKLTIKRQESLNFKHAGKVDQKQESYSSKQLGIILDVDTSDDPLRVSEYVQDIFKYLQEVEVKYSIDGNFLKSHPTSPRMRSVLVNWMTEVHLNFKFLLETLYLSVAIVNRYLQTNKLIGRETLQLVGASAMLVAAKYEEIYIPEISDFVYICDDTFTRKQLLKMEVDILTKLNFNFGQPLSIHFLRRYSKIVSASPEQHTLGKYLLELALIEYDMCSVKPSLQAAAACCLSVSVLNGLQDPVQAWTKTLSHYSSYKYADIKVTVTNLACALGRAELSKYQAIQTKYASSLYQKIGLNPKLKCNLIRKLMASSPALNKK